MAAEDFPAALKETLAYEGGFADNPRDPGGRTMKGVTQVSFNLYLKAHGKPSRDVRTITDSELQDIYKSAYWNKIDGDHLPRGLDMAAFDLAVNSGTGTATKALALVKKLSPVAAIKALTAWRLAFQRRLRTWVTFGRGWSRRDMGVQADALKLASVAPQVPQTAPTGSVGSAIDILAADLKNISSKK